MLFRSVSQSRYLPSHSSVWLDGCSESGRSESSIMNFLAHLYLSPSQPDFRVGSFAADGFKGSISSSLPLHLQKGIEAHRALDSFTDTHPVFRESTRLLASGYGKWAGVIADILYDHFLATHWPQLSETPLTTFSKECYSDLNRFLVLLPAVTKRIFPYMLPCLVAWRPLESVTLQGRTLRVS